MRKSWLVGAFGPVGKPCLRFAWTDSLPQTEKDRGCWHQPARKSSAELVPRLLCSFQTSLQRSCYHEPGTNARSSQPPPPPRPKRDPCPPRCRVDSRSNVRPYLVCSARVGAGAWATVQGALGGRACTATAGDRRFAAVERRRRCPPQCEEASPCPGASPIACHHGRFPPQTLRQPRTNNNNKRNNNHKRKRQGQKSSRSSLASTGFRC